MELDLHKAFKDKEACFFVSPERKNIEGDYYLLVAVDREAGFYQTEELLGKDLKVARLITKKRNRFLGISNKAARKIIHSSMLVQFEIEDIYGTTKH